jgi:hypothetical protein
MRFEHHTPRDEDSLLAAGEENEDPVPDDEDFVEEEAFDDEDETELEDETEVEGDPPDSDFVAEHEQDGKRKQHD